MNVEESGKPSYEETTIRSKSRRSESKAERAIRQIQPNLKDSQSISEAQTSAEILLREEVNRARGWALTSMIIPLLAICFVIWLDGRIEIKTIFCIACLFYIIPSAIIYYRIKTEDQYSPMMFRVWGYSSALISGVIHYTLGLFSPAPVIVTLGISFFGLGSDKKHAIMIAVVAIFVYLSLTICVILGILPDYGIFSNNSLSFQGMLFFGVMVPIVFLGALLSARISKTSIVNAIEQSVAAQQMVGQREALLDEVERDLEQVLNAGAGIGGRYTGITAGEYELGNVLGRGGMGEVYEAHHSESRQVAAVKLLRDDFEIEDDVYRRFLREGQVGGKLQVPNIVSVFDVGKLATGTPFIVMERLKGSDLSAQLRQTRRLSFEDAINLGVQVVTGISAAHQAGVIHRDIKPQNLLLHQPAPDLPAVWKILDFGVCKVENATVTETKGSVLGTPAYMAPEQARGDSVDHRIDLYSMGAVLYRALTGIAPFSGRSPFFAVVFKIPPQPRMLNPKLSLDMERFLALAMSKKPAERFDTAKKMLTALESASVEQLPEDVRRRADELIYQFPWGSTLGQATLSEKS